MLFDGSAERLLRVVAVRNWRFAGAVVFRGGRGECGRRTL